MFQEVEHLGDLYGVNRVQVDHLWAFLIQKFESNDFPNRVNQLSLAEALKLIQFEQGGQFTSAFLDSSLDDLQVTIDYWVSKIGKENLIRFISRTEHGNPYHLFLVDRERFNAYLDFLISAGIVGEGDSDRGLTAILNYHHWAEGVDTSRKVSVEDWGRWTRLFSLSDLSSRALAKIFTADYFRSHENRDFLQSLFLNLDVNILNIFENYPEYISRELLMDLLNPESIAFSGYAEYIAPAFERMRDLSIGSETGKRISLKVVHRILLSNFRELDDPETAERIINVVLEAEAQSCRGILSPL